MGSICGPLIWQKFRGRSWGPGQSTSLRSWGWEVGEGEGPPDRGGQPHEGGCGREKQREIGEENRRKTKKWDPQASMYPSLADTPQNKSPPFPVATTPTCSPFPVGAPRAAASFVEVGVQPQLPGLPQGPGKRRGPSGPRSREAGPRSGGGRSWGAPGRGVLRKLCWGCFASQLSAGPQGCLLRAPQGTFPPPEEGQREGPHPAQSEARSFLVREVAWWGHLCQQGSPPLMAVSLQRGQSQLRASQPLPWAPGTSGSDPLPLPDDVLQGLQQRLLLVLDAVLGAQRLHERRHLVEVVPWHGGEEAGESADGEDRPASARSPHRRQSGLERPGPQLSLCAPHPQEAGTWGELGLSFPVNKGIDHPALLGLQDQGRPLVPALCPYKAWATP